MWTKLSRWADTTKNVMVLQFSPRDNYVVELQTLRGKSISSPAGAFEEHSETD